MNKLKTYKFSDLYEMSSGISSKPEQAGHGYPFVSFNSVFQNYFLPENLPDLMNTSFEEREKYSVKTGDIFLTRTSETLDELGMSSVAISDYINASYSGFLKRLRPKHSDITYPKFMAFYLRSELFRKTMNNNAIMTLRASLNEQIFSYLNLILPPYDVQVRIGDFLFSLHEKIEINRKIHKVLDELTKHLFNYWFVQFDFPNTQGLPFKSSGGEMLYSKDLKREIPQGWNIISLGNLCNIYQPKTISGKELISDGEHLVYGSNSIIGRYNKYNHEESEIAVSCRGNCGNIFRTIPKSWITGNAMIFKLKDEKVNNEFLYQTLQWINIKSSSSGSVQGQLTRTNVSPLLTILPERNVLLQFSEIVEPIVNEKLLIQFEIQKLTELRDWLLPMLMNGQVTVKEAEERLSMAAEPSVEYKKG